MGRHFKNISKYFIVVAFVFLLPNTVFAQMTPAQFKQWNNGVFNSASLQEAKRLAQSSESPIFKSTVKLCLDGSVTGTLRLVYDGGKQALLVGIGALPVGTEASSKATIDLFRNRGLSKELGQMLSSEEFYDAVEYCYPQNTAKQISFISSLVAADLGGKILGGIGSYYIDIGAYATGGWLLKGFNVPTKVIKTVKIVQWSSIGVSAIAAATMGLENYYQKKEDEKQKKEADDLRAKNLASAKNAIASDEQYLQNPNLTPDLRDIYESDLAKQKALKEQIEKK